MDNTLNDGNLYCDTRIGGIEKWYYLTPKDAEMRIPDDLLDTVCFLCVKVQGKYGLIDYFIGTGFLIGRPSKQSGFNFTYLVTARHVLDDARAEGYTTFYVRLNTLDGGSQTVELSSEWTYPANPAIDVAALLFNPNPSIFQCLAFPADACATKVGLKTRRIGVGDELFMLGLFNQRWGHQRNIPIVRSGIIASMPTEPFMDEEGENLYNAYLVEIRSINGLSGSPVFAYLDVWRTMPANTRFINVQKTKWEIYLIGLLRGHWDLKKQDAIFDSSINSEIDRLNTGIAQVTPAEDILALINSEELMKQRKEIEKEWRQRHAPTLDSNLPSKPPEAEGITQEGFEDALKRASRKITQPDEEAKDSNPS